LLSGKSLTSVGQKPSVPKKEGEQDFNDFIEQAPGQGITKEKGGAGESIVTQALSVAHR